MKRIGIGAVAALLMAFGTAHADITAGVILSMTGPAATLGKPEKEAISLFPKTIGGQKIDYIFLDSGTDPTKAVKDAKKLIQQHHVDLIIGPSITPNALAVIDVVAAAKVPEIAIVPSVANPVTKKTRWVFSTPQANPLMAEAVVKDMVKRDIKTVGFIGFNDAYGEMWLHDFSAAAGAKGIKIVDTEKFERSATSVTGQALHIKAAAPQAVLVAASGTPAALPVTTLKQMGYSGRIYETHAAANPDFLRVCGDACNGVILPVSPGVVADQLPDSNPVKAAAMKFANAYEGKYGKYSTSQFASNAWSTGVLLEHAIPVALKHAQPQNKVKFRAALRNALEGLKNVASSDGIYNMSATDHSGLDNRAVVVVQVVDGHWKLVQ